MNARVRTGFLLAALMAAAGGTLAQTPAQMEYERQQREYWRAQEQQRQEQQRQQQLMQDNARRQQEGISRPVQGQGSQYGEPSGPTAGGSRGAGGSTAAAQLEQARQSWLKRPPLPTAQNPLIGQWTRPVNRANPNDPFAQLGALMKGGLCEVFFSGDAVFEYRSNALVGIDKRTHRVEPLDTVEYRGGGKQVVVIPKATLKLLVFDFDGQDRISWSGQNCVLTRVSAASQATVTGTRR
jgi:hypothetical protein